MRFGLDLAQQRMPWDELAHASKWRDAGCGYLVCGWPGAGQPPVEAFARDVMPEFTDK